MRTVQDITAGPKSERRQADARNGIKMTVEEVRWAIDTLERNIKQRPVRVKMARLGAVSPMITEAGQRLYAEYADILAAN